jgi:hypothetical protein
MFSREIVLIIPNDCPVKLDRAFVLLGQIPPLTGGCPRGNGGRSDQYHGVIKTSVDKS